MPHTVAYSSIEPPSQVAVHHRPSGPEKSPGDPDPSGPPGESGKWGRSSLTDRGEFPRPKLSLNLNSLRGPLRHANRIAELTIPGHTQAKPRSRPGFAFNAGCAVTVLARLGR